MTYRERVSALAKVFVEALTRNGPEEGFHLLGRALGGERRGTVEVIRTDETDVVFTFLRRCDAVEGVACRLFPDPQGLFLWQDRRYSAEELARISWPL